MVGFSFLASLILLLITLFLLPIPLPTCLFWKKGRGLSGRLRYLVLDNLVILRNDPILLDPNAVAVHYLIWVSSRTHELGGAFEKEELTILCLSHTVLHIWPYDSLLSFLLSKSVVCRTKWPHLHSQRMSCWIQTKCWKKWWRG